MPDYQQGKIYSVRSLSRPDLIYIGSTTQPLSRRMAQHRSIHNTASKEIVEIGDSYIELIENYACADRYELEARENRHMRALVCINKQVALDDCPHGKTQSRCVECHGKGLCEHQRTRSQCKDCGGSQVCEHNKIRSVCKDCGGASICEHKIQRRMCKKCDGSSFCEHNRRKNNCKDCGGVSVCTHNRLRAQCKDCGGSNMCEHKSRRIACVICSPVECETCDETISKGNYKRHLKTQNHKNNVVAMNIEDVPES